MTINQTVLEDHAHRLLTELSAGYGGVMVSIGAKLGLYKAMDGAGPLTSQELADRTGCAERYIREWLNTQVSGEYVVYHPATNRYELTPELGVILADETSPYTMLHGWQIVASMWADEDKTLRAFRTGEGVAWGDHDGRMVCGVAAFFRNSYNASLVESWLPALDGMTDRLARGATVADVGCGHGYSTVLMAKAYPASRFHGFDAHEESIEAARELARKEGVSERVTFETADAATYGGRDYDLICFFDALHDMGRPLDAAHRARQALAQDGTVMLIEPFAGDRVEDNINPVSRLYYAGSTALCCAHAISERGTHVLGAQAGAAQLGDLLREAGFSRVRKATETPFNMVIEARP